MRWLLFGSRLAFICNLFFLVALSLKVSAWITNNDIIATVLILGYFLVVLVNPLVNLIYGLLFIFRRKFWTVVPPWLITANILFLVLQIFYIIYLNDTSHH